MSWRNLLFAHWPVDPATLLPHLPPGLALDTSPGMPSPFPAAAPGSSRSASNRASSLALTVRLRRIHPDPAEVAVEEVDHEIADGR